MTHIGVTSVFEQLALARHHGLPARLLDVTRNPLVALYHASETDCNCGFKHNSGCDGAVHVFAIPECRVKGFNSDTVSVLASLSRLSMEQQKHILSGHEYKGDTGHECDLDSDAKKSPGIGETRCNVALRLLHFVKQEKPYFEDRVKWNDFEKVFAVQPKVSFARIAAQAGAFLLAARPETITQVNERRFDFYRSVTIPANFKDRLLKELAWFNVTRETMRADLDASASQIVGELQ